MCHLLANFMMGSYREYLYFYRQLRLYRKSDEWEYSDRGAWSVYSAMVFQTVFCRILGSHNKSLGIPQRMGREVVHSHFWARLPGSASPHSIGVRVLWQKWYERKFESHWYSRYSTHEYVTNLFNLLKILIPRTGANVHWKFIKTDHPHV